MNRSLLIDKFGNYYRISKSEQFIYGYVHELELISLENQLVITRLIMNKNDIKGYNIKRASSLAKELYDK